jgi:hypothetical protein
VLGAEIGQTPGLRPDHATILPVRNGEALADLADFGQCLTRRKCPYNPELAKPIDLRREQGRKHLVVHGLASPEVAA